MLSDLEVGLLVFFFIVALQGFVLASLVFFKRPARAAHRFLGLLLLIFSFTLLNAVFEESIHAFHAKYPIPIEFGWLTAPFAYFHVRFATDPQLRWRPIYLWHFLPSLLFDVIFFMAFFLLGRSHMEYIYAHLSYVWYTFVAIALGTCIQSGIYTWLAYRHYQLLSYKDTEPFKPVITWLRPFALIWLLALGFFALTLLVILMDIERADAGILMRTPIAAMTSIAMYWLGYRYLLQSGQVVQRYGDRQQGRRVATEELSDRKQLLKAHVQQHQLFTDPKLSVDQLAAHIGWPAREVSEVAGEISGSHFNDFINRLRVEAFLGLAEGPDRDRYSIAGLAADVGFNSKASFYRAFKKVTGQTPTSYLK